jgi:hypothetical protein
MEATERMASSRVSPATNLRAKPWVLPSRATHFVKLFFADSQKIRSRIGFVVFAPSVDLQWRI